MDTEKRFCFMRQWLDYLKEPASEDEINLLSRQWNIDLDKLLTDIKEAESNIETKKPQNRAAVPAELDPSL